MDKTFYHLRLIRKGISEVLILKMNLKSIVSDDIAFKFIKNIEILELDKHTPSKEEYHIRTEQVTFFKITK